MRKNRRLQLAHKDDKLSAEGDSTTRRIFAIFDKANCIKFREIRELEKYAKPKKLRYFPTLLRYE